MAPFNTSLKPQFFVGRRDGKRVPLIAMDEIPTNIVFHGVPRALEMKDTVGMTSVGEHDSSHTHYHVEFAGPRANPFEGLPDMPDVLSSDTSLLDSPFTLPTAPVPSGSTYLFPANGSLVDIDLDEPNAAPIDRSLFASKHAPSPNHQLRTSNPNDRSLHASKYASPRLNFEKGYSAQPSTYTIEARPPLIAFAKEGKGFDTTGLSLEGLTPEDLSDLALIAEGKKVYCGHWLSRGECGFVQPGCRYKHKMHSHPVMLAAVGLTDIPQWYRDKYGVRSIHAVPGSGAAGGPANIAKIEKMEGNWRSNTANNDTRNSTSSDSNQGDFIKPSGTPARPASGSQPHSAKSRRPAARFDKAARSGAKRSQKPAMKLDDVARINAIAQLEQSEAKEVERKANFSARVAKATTMSPSSGNTGPPAVDSRPSSRDTDSSFSSDTIPGSGLNSSATSGASDADTEGHGGRNSKKGESIKVNVRFPNTKTGNQVSPSSQRICNSTPKRYTKRTTFTHSTAQNTRQDGKQGGEISGYAVNFQAPSGAEMQAWTPDGYDHDD